MSDLEFVPFLWKFCHRKGTFSITGATLASEPLFRYTSIAVDHLQEYEVYIMKYQIKDGTVTLGGETILSHIDFEIQGNQKIAVVGRNGAGKTTLLRLIAGELSLDRDDRRQGPGSRLPDS